MDEECKGTDVMESDRLYPRYEIIIKRLNKYE
jgi:hypothetical protein